MASSLSRGTSQRKSKRLVVGSLGLLLGLILWVVARPLIMRVRYQPPAAVAVAPPAVAPDHISDASGLVLAQGMVESAAALAHLQPNVLPMRPAASPARPVSDPDAAWKRMRVGSSAIVEHIRLSAALLKHDVLFRHAELNPRDVYLSPEQRMQLAALTEPFLRTLNEQLAVRHSVAKQEMQAYAQAGGTHSASMKDIRVSKHGHKYLSDADPKGEFDLHAIIDGRLHMARSRDLPGSALAASLMHDTGTQLGIAIVGWFYNQGCLTQAELNALTIRFATPVTWNGR